MGMMKDGGHAQTNQRARKLLKWARQHNFEMVVISKLLKRLEGKKVTITYDEFNFCPDCLQVCGDVCKCGQQGLKVRLAVASFTCPTCKQEVKLGWDGYGVCPCRLNSLTYMLLASLQKVVRRGQLSHMTKVFVETLFRLRGNGYEEKENVEQ